MAGPARMGATARSSSGREPDADEALRAADGRAAAGPGRPGPIVLMDVGDNIGGGGPGDSTILLEAAQRLGIRGFLCILFDPAAVRINARTPAKVAWSRRRWAPTPTSGTAGRSGSRAASGGITDGRYEDPEPVHGGYRFFDAGRTAVLDTTDGQTIVLTSRLLAPRQPRPAARRGGGPAVARGSLPRRASSRRGPAYERVASSIVAGRHARRDGERPAPASTTGTGAGRSSRWRRELPTAVARGRGRAAPADRDEKPRDRAAECDPQRAERLARAFAGRTSREEHGRRSGIGPSVAIGASHSLLRSLTTL